MTIAEIRARRAAITPGEWYRYMRGVMVKDYSTDTGVAHVAVANQIGTDNIMDAPQGTSNATFIAAAPADIDYLLATIDKLAAALVEARAGLRMATAFSNDEMGIFDDEKPYYDDARRTIKQEFGI